MKLGYVILYVSQVSQLVDFYEKALGLNRKFVHESGQYAEMDTGSTTLAFACNRLAKSNLPKRMKVAGSSASLQECPIVRKGAPTLYRKTVSVGLMSPTAPKLDGYAAPHAQDQDRPRHEQFGARSR